MIARWLWAKVIQQALNEFVDQRNNTTIRGQKKTHMPSGASPLTIYDYPDMKAAWQGSDVKIPLPVEHLDALVEEHIPPGFFNVLDDHGEEVAGALWAGIGSPIPTRSTVWTVFSQMMSLHHSCAGQMASVNDH